MHFALLVRHLHLFVEANDREALSRGMQGFGVRLARRLNKELGRRGRILQDRYHEHILKTPQEVRNALCYVLRNSARHEAEMDTTGGVPGVDPFSSGVYFDGGRNYRGGPRAGPDPPPVAHAGQRASRSRYGCIRTSACPEEMGSTTPLSDTSTAMASPGLRRVQEPWSTVYAPLG